jgi:hypothetical protein
MTLKTFAPSGAATVKVAGGPTAGNIALDVNSSVVRVYNAGPDAAYVRFGSASDAATVNDIPLPAGAPELFTKGTAGYMSVITDAAKSALVYATNGEGM